MSKYVKTVTEQIYQEIRSEILMRKFRPGEKMTVKMLQEKYGVSSTPIREALTRLQQDGLIDYQPNVGMNVVEYIEKDIKDIFTLMSELDVFAMRLALNAGKMAELVSELRYIQEQAAQRLEIRDCVGFEDYSDQFHLAFYKFADNSRLSIAAEKTRIQLTVFSCVYQQTVENQRSISKEHDQIVLLLAKGRYDEAETALRGHLVESMNKALAENVLFLKD